jgi:hypothetical protein
MNNWTRIYLSLANEKFNDSRTHSEQLVWLFEQGQAEKGVVPGTVCKYLDQAEEPSEFFFDASGNPAFPSHWLQRKSANEKPRSPGVSYLLCKDGEPHDWDTKPMRDDQGAKAGGDMTVCAKCGAMGDSD